MPNNNGGGPLKIGSPKSVIKFGEKINGFRMMYTGTVDDSNFTITYDSVAGETGRDGDLIYLFNDEAVNVIASALPLYTPGANIQESGVRFTDIQDSMSDDFWNSSMTDMPYDESTTEYGITHTLASTYMMLDPDWSNDVEPASTPRVQIAQGQSDITRHESYFKEEMSPNYKFQKELPKYFVYRRITADENTAMNTTRSGTKASGTTYLNGIREDICGRYFETDEEYPLSIYVHVCRRYIYDKGTPQERVVYSWEINTPIEIPASAKIELDIPSLNSMEYINHVSQEVDVKKGEWYKVLDMLQSEAASIDGTDPQINEIMAAKPLSTLKEHIANIHIYGRNVNNAIGLAIEPGTDIYCVDGVDEEDNLNYTNVTGLTSYVTPMDNKYYFFYGEIVESGTIYTINFDYNQSIDEYDITADTVIWNKEAMSLDNYQQLPHGDLLPETYTMNFIWHVPYGYDKHNGNNLGIARNMIREALVEKGANVSGIGELKLFSNRASGDGEDPINGPFVLVDNTGKKLGLTAIDVDEINENYLAAYCEGVSCPYDGSAITDGAALYIESSYTNSYYSGIDPTTPHESIINTIKNTIPYDELYEINATSEPIELPSTVNCAIYLEKY